MKNLNALLGAALFGSALALTPAAMAQRSPVTPTEYYQAEFLAAVNRNLPALRACYDAAQPEGDAAWGRLRTATVVINSDGTIGPVALQPGPGAPGIEACMRVVFERWRLTPPQGGRMTLTYTRAQLQRAMMPPRPPRRGRR